MKDRLTLKEYKALAYKVVLERRRSEGSEGYTAYIAELGKLACYGIGETVDKALSMLAEVKDELLTYYYENGVAIPLPEEEDYTYSGKFVVRTGPELHKKLAQRAKQENQSLNSFVVAALWSAVVQPAETAVCTTAPEILYSEYQSSKEPRPRLFGVTKDKYFNAA